MLSPCNLEDGFRRAVLHVSSMLTSTKKILPRRCVRRRCHSGKSPGPKPRQCLSPCSPAGDVTPLCQLGCATHPRCCRSSGAAAQDRSQNQACTPQILHSVRIPFASCRNGGDNCNHYTYLRLCKSVCCLDLTQQHRVRGGLQRRWCLIFCPRMLAAIPIH